MTEKRSTKPRHTYYISKLSKDATNFITSETRGLLFIFSAIFRVSSKYLRKIRLLMARIQWNNSKIVNT